MDRYPTNLPIIEQSKARSEVLHGPERRRRWTADEKARIVAESLAPDAVASAVARRHGIHPNQLYGWRREVREATAPTEFVAVTVAAEPITKKSPVNERGEVRAHPELYSDMDANVVHPRGVWPGDEEVREMMIFGSRTEMTISLLLYPNDAPPRRWGSNDDELREWDIYDQFMARG